MWSAPAAIALAATASLALRPTPTPSHRQLTSPSSHIAVAERDAQHARIAPAPDPEPEDNGLFDTALSALPYAVPAVAFVGFDEFIGFFTFLIDHAPGNWDAVDGGIAQVAKLTPIATGVVLPSLSIALGTLSAATITSLRNRQVSLRTLINKEACLLDLLFSGTETIFGGPRRAAEREEALQLLAGYVQRLIGESRVGSARSPQTQGAADSELRQLTRVLHNSPPIRDAVDADGTRLLWHEAGLAGQGMEWPAPSAAARAQPQPEEPRFFTSVEFNAQIHLKELALLRSERLALLTTTFPAVHWLSMALLGGSLLGIFALLADDQVLQFLDNLQLRLLFTFLVGSLTGIAAVCIDLNDPFRGSFTVAPALDQLYGLGDDLDRVVAQDQEAAAVLAQSEEAAVSR